MPQTHRLPWKPTEYQGISERAGLYRAFLGRQYLGTHASLPNAKEAVVTASGHEVACDRTKRDQLQDFLDKSSVYLDWAADGGFVPADLVAARNFRTRFLHLVRAACRWE